MMKSEKDLDEIIRKLREDGKKTKTNTTKVKIKEVEEDEQPIIIQEPDVTQEQVTPTLLQEDEDKFVPTDYIGLIKTEVSHQIDMHKKDIVDDVVSLIEEGLLSSMNNIGNMIQNQHNLLVNHIMPIINENTEDVNNRVANIEKKMSKIDKKLSSIKLGNYMFQNKYFLGWFVMATVGLCLSFFTPAKIFLQGWSLQVIKTVVVGIFMLFAFVTAVMLLINVYVYLSNKLKKQKNTNKKK